MSVPPAVFTLHGMTDTAKHTLVTGPAVPLSITVNRDNGYWVLRAWYHGTTAAQALHPKLVGERVFSHDEVPYDATWRALWLSCAIAVNDLAELSGGIARGD